MKCLITFFACTALLGVMKAVSIYWDADVILLLYHLQWWLYFGHKCKEQLISMHQLTNCSFHSVYIPFPLLTFCYLEYNLWSFSDFSCHRCPVCKRVSAHFAECVDEGPGYLVQHKDIDHHGLWSVMIMGARHRHWTQAAITCENRDDKPHMLQCKCHNLCYVI